MCLLPPWPLDIEVETPYQALGMPADAHAIRS